MGKEVSQNALDSHRRSGGMSAGRKSLPTHPNFPGSVGNAGPLPIAEVGLGEKRLRNALEKGARSCKRKSGSHFHFRESPAEFRSGQEVA